MQQMLDEAFRAGGFGLSFSLAYLRGFFATADELAALAGVTARCGRLVAAHMRNEGDRLLGEMLEVAEASGAFLEVSHLKAVGLDNWGRASDALARLEMAERVGLRVGCDVYPSTATSTTVFSLIPPVFL